MMVHTWYPSTWKVEAGGSEIQGQHGLCKKFKDNLGYKISIQSLLPRD